jgi:PAS domain S-box-containing protein
MTAACIVSAIAIWGTVHGQGSLAGVPLNTQLLLLQSFMATAALVGLTVGAAHTELEERICERTRDLGGALDELRYSERRLQTIIDAEPACVKLVSTDGTVLEMNPAGLQMLGAATAADVLGRSIVDVVHPEDRDRFLEAHRSAAAGSASRSEFRIVGLDGRERCVDSHLVPFDTTHRGEARRAVLSVTSDVTERKRLEEQLRQSQKLEAVGMLAGGIAHDFNNLLTAIGGFTDIVLETLPAGDERRGDLQEVAKAAQRGAALTRQLLAVSRRQILQPSVLDVNDVVAEVQKLLHRTIPRNIDVQLELASNLGLVRADRGQIEQVLLNLAINAGDAMPDGGRLRLATTMVAVDEAAARRHPPMSPGCYVRLTVSDTGVGMTPEVRAHVFEPFFTTKDQGKGTGLGLATVYGIVKQSGGFIWLDSTPSKGTIFDIYLPVVPEGVGESKDTDASLAEHAQRSHTILLAEDDGAVRRLARDVLTRHGYTVLDARDGEEALALAHERRDAIHLLITDMVMPGLSGRDLAARVGAQRPGMRVLYTTGYSERLVSRTGIEEGLVLLPKPFLPADLLRKVGEALSAP